ncbi:MAG: hypothetical protein E7469_07370 [Ruminococcaceae bacterium]|nr:hypothetical protein [Oscillospiraceae bacterium]
MKKKLLTVLCALLILWGAMFATDYLLVSHFREPVFVLYGVTADDGGSYTGQGLGYTVVVDKYITPDGGSALVSVTMTVFDRVIAAAIT